MPYIAHYPPNSLTTQRPLQISHPPSGHDHPSPNNREGSMNDHDNDEFFGKQGTIFLQYHIGATNLRQLSFGRKGLEGKVLLAP